MYPTIADTAMPIRNSCAAPSASGSRRTFRPSCAAAAAIAGTPSRNEKRAAASRRSPRNNASVRVAPDRDTPGTRAADCAQPSAKPSPVPRSSACRTRLDARSAHNSRSPPTASVTPTTAGFRSASSTSRSRRPTMTTGIVPTAISQAMRAGSSCCLESTRGAAIAMRNRSCRKYTSTASSVPRWQATSNASPNLSVSHPKNAFARIRWAELDTGRNSVSPWITPSSTASSRITTWCAEAAVVGTTGRHSRPAGAVMWSGHPHVAPRLARHLWRGARRLPRVARGLRSGRPPAELAAAQDDCDRGGDEDGRVRSRDDTHQHGERESAQHLSAEQVQGQHGEEGRARGQERPPERLVDAGIHDLVERLTPHRPHVFAHSIEDDDRVVDRVPGNRQDGRHDIQRELVAGKRHHGQDHEDVVERGHECAGSEDQSEPQSDVRTDAKDGGERCVDALPLQVLPHDRADDLGAEHVELADVRLLNRRNRLLRDVLEAEPLLLIMRLRKPNEDFVLGRITVLLHYLLAGQGVERTAHGGVADRLLEAEHD